MSSPNGQVPTPEPEPVNYADVIDYWRELVLDLHSRLSVSAAQLRGRDRVIEHLRAQIASSTVSSQTPGDL